MDLVNISLPVSSLLGTSQTVKPVTQDSLPVTPQPQPKEVAAAPSTAEQARYAEVFKASQIVQSNYFVVSDVRFTIYKDVVGDYVTRFTSLKDGKVTYFPQKSLMEIMKIKDAQQKAIFHTEV